MPTDLENLITIQKSLAALTIRNQQMERDYREVRRLLDRSMDFASHIIAIKKDYDTLIEREKLGLRG